VVEDCAPITRSFENAGSYDVMLLVDAGNGCGADTLDADDLITIHQRPIAAFEHSPEGINTLDPVVQFNNTSIGGINFSWDVAGLSTSTDVNTSYRFPDELSADYTVCLIAMVTAGCADSVCHVIEIEEGPSVYVPNTFTPDGSGSNDSFKPVVLGIDPDHYHFDIFDRWGQPLYSTNDPDGTWDGLFSDHTEVPIGVYAWKLVAKDLYSGARFERIGHVTLLR